MTYILLIMIYISNGGGGLSAEFNSLNACEAARHIFIIAQHKDGWADRNPRWYEEEERQLVCVPKG